VLLRAAGAGAWSLRVRHRLPPGRYRLVARAVDRAGNREMPGRNNKLKFRVR
jgi:hypothetical protein